MLLHLHEWGEDSAPPVICVHGVGGHGARFRKLAEERLAADRRVLAPDLRGHGRSDWDPPWNLDVHVQDLLETVEAAGVQSAAWLGFSFGGRLAAEIALRAPERVERMALLDPALELPADQALEAADGERLEQSFASAEEAIDARLESGTLYSTPREILEEEMEEHLMPLGDGRVGFRYSKSAVVAAWGEMARPAPQIAHLRTLMVLGERSYIPSDGQPERYRAELDKAFEVHSLQAGHSLLWDRFDETADAVRDFLDA